MPHTLRNRVVSCEPSRLNPDTLDRHGCAAERLVIDATVAAPPKSREGDGVTEEPHRSSSGSRNQPRPGG